METRQSKIITAYCDRIKKQVDEVFQQNARVIEKELNKKISSLDFYLKEFVSRKERLVSHTSQLITLRDEIQRSVNSLQYPKEICNQCTEIRENVIASAKDEVQRELGREIDLISRTESQLQSLVKKLEEQIRRHRAAIYALDEDARRKSSILKMEKNNKTLRTTDTDTQRLIQTNRILATSTPQFDWEEESKLLLQNADTQYSVGMELQREIEETLLLDIEALTKQHNLCNKAFDRRIAENKDEKDSLELKCRQINEEIPRQKLNLRNIEDMIADNECHKKLAQVRFNNRVESTYTELMKDNVEVALRNELKRLNSAKDDLRNAWSQAVLALKSLNEKRKQYEVRMHAKSDAIKVDEVECLPLRSSIHYHTYQLKSTLPVV